MRDVQVALNARGEKTRAYTTLLTVMTRLDGKRLLTRRRAGRYDVYVATLSRGEYLAARAEASARRASQLAELDANIARVRGLLANASFVDRAPEAVVARERERLTALERERGQLAAGG